MAQAFDDAELNDEVQKSGLEKNPQPGEHIEQLVNDLLNTPDAVRSRFKQLSGR